MNNNLKQANSHLRLLVAVLFAAGPLALAAGCDDAEPTTTPADAADHTDHDDHEGHDDDAGHDDHDDHDHEEHGNAGPLGAAHLALAAMGGR